MASRTLFFTGAALRFPGSLRLHFTESQSLKCNAICTQSGFYQRLRQPARHLASFKTLPPQRIPQGNNRPQIDEEIEARSVQIVRPEGTLGEPISLADALQSFDRTQNVLLKVADPGLNRTTVCKIVSKREYWEQQRVRLKSDSSKSADSAPIKQIELNWAIDQHDLSHRMKQMETFLSKGKRVHLLLLRKKNKRAATADEAQGLLEAVQRRIKEIGAMQVKPMKGKLLHQVEFFLEKTRNS